MAVFLRFVMQMISVPHRYVVSRVYTMFTQIVDNLAYKNTPSIIFRFWETAYIEHEDRIFVGCDTVLLYV
jgi:hypothetical protein